MAGKDQKMATPTGTEGRRESLDARVGVKGEEEERGERREERERERVRNERKNLTEAVLYIETRRGP